MKSSLKHTAVIVGLFLISFFLITPLKNISQPMSLGRIKNNETLLNEYFLPNYFNEIHGKLGEVRFIVGKILGTTLNIDWYKACLINDSSLKLGEEFQKPLKIGVIIVPIKRNVTIYEIDFWKKSLLSIQDQQANWKPISGVQLIADYGIPSCLNIFLDDMGFLYGGLIYFLNDQTVGVTTLSEEGIRSFPLEDGRVFNLGNSKLEIKVTKASLWTKRSVLFFALCGLYLLILNIGSLIYGRTHKNYCFPKIK